MLYFRKIWKLDPDYEFLLSFGQFAEIQLLSEFVIFSFCKLFPSSQTVHVQIIIFCLSLKPHLTGFFFSPDNSVHLFSCKRSNLNAYKCLYIELRIFKIVKQYAQKAKIYLLSKESGIEYNMALMHRVVDKYVQISHATIFTVYTQIQFLHIYGYCSGHQTIAFERNSE